MDAPFIFINSFAIKEGKLKDFRQFLPGFFKAIEANEPRLLALNAYLNEDVTEVTFVQVHRDAASMAHEHAARAQPFLDAITSIQVYGAPERPCLERSERTCAIRGLRDRETPSTWVGSHTFRRPLPTRCRRRRLTERRGTALGLQPSASLP